MSKQVWKDVPIAKIHEWQTSFNADAEGVVVPGFCPVCGQESLRHYYYLSNIEPLKIRGISYQGKGSLWEWCSSCRTYSHSQAYVPEKWAGPQLDLDHSQLTPLPDVIDEFTSKLT